MKLQFYRQQTQLRLFLWLLLLLLISSVVCVPGNRSACRQAQAPGLCRGKLLRYAYNEKTDNCVSFYYTGCASTDNNFLTYEECRRDCMAKLRY